MSSARRRSSSRKIRIRMYRVGFGDCFLVTFPSGDHVLVDCGVHSRGDIKTLEDVLDDIEAETQRRLAIIVVSHAHQDHIAGFARGEQRFRTFEIGEIWMPWTEDPKDRTARDLRRHQAALLGDLTEHFAARPAGDDILAVLANAAARTNATALDALRSGFGTGARVRWLEKDDELDEPGGVKGLGVRILGPPRDPAFLKKMDPPEPERYMKVGTDGRRSWVDAIEPFRAEHRRRLSTWPSLASPQENAVRSAAELSADILAFALDRALNNTSLVCLFSYRGQGLLFPGDAQFGSWKAWIESDDAPAVLSSVDFYKVSHHGSENATPKTALEGMTSGRMAAMLSTQSVPWPSIPYVGIMDALERQTSRRVVRSDSLPLPDAPAGPEISRMPKGFRKGRLWIDYFLEF